MTAEEQDISLYERETKTIDPSPLTEKDSGDAVDLSNSDLQWKVIEDDSPIIEKSTSGGGITITDAANGGWEISLESSDTDGYGGTIAEHEGRLVDSQNNDSVVTEGKFTIKTSDT